MNILVAGATRFRLLRRIDELPYPAGDVELAESDDGAGDPQLLAEARECYSALVERLADERPDEDSLEGLDAFGMAATIEFDAKAKQRLLEVDTENDRL